MAPYSRAQMVSIQAQIVLLHLGTDGPMALGHRWSLFYSGTDGPVAFGHRWSHCIRTYEFLLDPGTDGPFRNQAQMILLYLGTDGPIAFVHRGSHRFVHTSSYGNQTQWPHLVGHRWSLFRHRKSCCTGHR